MAMIVSTFTEYVLGRLADFIKESIVVELGVKDELTRLQTKVEWIKAVLKDAERRSFQEETINLWLNELKDVLYEADDIIDECRCKAPNLLKDQPSSSSNPLVSSSSPSQFSTIPIRHEIGIRIKALISRLEEIDNNRKTFYLEHTIKDDHETEFRPHPTTSLADLEVVGKEVKVAAEDLANLIISDQEQRLRVFAIVGMAGIGKTTLAQQVFNSQRIIHNFSLRVWLCISQTPSEIQILKALIRSGGGDPGHERSIEELQQTLVTVIAEKNVFLVLDDVWSTKLWNEFLRKPFQRAASGRNFGD